MVLDMQARMTDMSSSLRLDFQEDASKMLVSLMNNLRQPASARGAETHAVQVQDLSFPTSGMDEVMNRISQVADSLESKSSTLEELAGRVSRHDGQIHLLMEAAQNHLPTPPPAPPASDTALRDYFDKKIQALREELMAGMDVKLADLKNSCDYKILSVQEECEGQGTNYLSLAELMESKEADLRDEIQNLKAKLVVPANESSLSSGAVLARLANVESHLNSFDKNKSAPCCSAEERLKLEHAEAVKDLRENLEDKLASMEDRLAAVLLDTGAVVQLRGQAEDQDALQTDLNSLKFSVQTLENRFDVLDGRCSKECDAKSTVLEIIKQDLQSCRSGVDAMETRLEAQINDFRTTQRLHQNTSTSIQDVRGALSLLKGRTDRMEESLADVVRRHLQTPPSLNSSSGRERWENVHQTQHRDPKKPLEEQGRKGGCCKEQTEEMMREISQMSGRIAAVESLCSKLDPMSAGLEKVTEGLNTHIRELWTCVDQLNGTVRAQAADIAGLMGTCQNLQKITSGLDLRPDVVPGTTGELVNHRHWGFADKCKAPPHFIGGSAQMFHHRGLNAFLLASFDLQPRAVLSPAVVSDASFRSLGTEFPSHGWRQR